MPSTLQDCPPGSDVQYSIFLLIFFRRAENLPIFGVGTGLVGPSQSAVFCSGAFLEPLPLRMRILLRREYYSPVIYFSEERILESSLTLPQSLASSSLEGVFLLAWCVYFFEGTFKS